MQFCTNCGKQVKEGSAFCGNCGTAVAKTSTSPSTKPAFYQEFAQSMGIGKRVVFTDTSLIHGDTEYPYTQLSPIRLTTAPTFLTNGVAEVIANGKELILTYTSNDKDRFAAALTYANEQIDLAHGKTKNYKYVLQVPSGTKLEVYDDYVIMHYVQTSAGGIMGSVTDKAGDVSKGLGNVLGGLGSITQGLGNAMKGGTIGKIIMFTDLTLLNLDGDNLIVNEYTIPLNAQNMDLAKQIISYIEETRNSAAIDVEMNPEEQELWEPIKGSEKTFSFNGEELHVPENMDIFNTYRMRFRDLASKYTDIAEAEYKKKVHDLVTFMEFFPRIYSSHLQTLAQKATDIFITEGIWSITADSFLKEHTENFHLALNDLNTMAESIRLTVEGNVQGVAKIASFVPNMQGFGFGLKGAVKGMAMAEAFNFVRDGIESKSVQSAMNIKHAQQHELYQRIKPELLFQNVHADYWNIFLTIVWKLRGNKRDIWWPKTELEQQANGIFQNLSNPNFPQDKIVSVVLGLLKLNPYNEDYHKYMVSRFGDTEEVMAIRNYFGY